MSSPKYAAAFSAKFVRGYVPDFGITQQHSVDRAPARLTLSVELV